MKLDDDIKNKIYKANKLLCLVAESESKTKIFTDKYDIYLLDFIKKIYYTIDEDEWFTLCDECQMKWHIKHHKDYTVVKCR